MPYHLAAVALTASVMDDVLVARQRGDTVRLSCLLHECGGLFNQAYCTRVPKKAHETFVEDMHRIFVKAWEMGGEEFEKDYGTPKGFRAALNATR